MCSRSHTRSSLRDLLNAREGLTPLNRYSPEESRSPAEPLIERISLQRRQRNYKNYRDKPWIIGLIGGKPAHQSRLRTSAQSVRVRQRPASEKCDKKRSSRRTPPSSDRPFRQRSS